LLVYGVNLKGKVMTTRSFYIDVDKSPENTYVNIFEVFQQLYLSYFNKIYTKGLEHSDIIELAEKDSYLHFLNIASRLKKFTSDIPLVHGLNECLIEVIETYISVGQSYQVELVLIDDFSNETLERYDLKKYVTIKNPETGQAELKVENAEYPLSSSFILLRQSVLYLRVSGSIRINSPVKVVARLNEDIR
jgi:hypothetical protein